MTKLIQRVSTGLLLAILALGMAGPVATATEDSRQVAEVQQYSHHYSVYYHCHGWEYYGCYNCPQQAQSVAYQLQRRGHVTRIVCGY